MYGHDEAFFFQLIIGLFDRKCTDPQFTGKGSDRGKSFVLRESSAYDRVFT